MQYLAIRYYNTCRLISKLVNNLGAERWTRSGEQRELRIREFSFHCDPCKTIKRHSIKVAVPK